MSQEFTVCVTGAAGNIAYAFIPLLLKGNVFGNKKINLRLLDITSALGAMKGVAMEIFDSNFALLKSLKYGDEPEQMFKNADVIVFIGGFPRKKGMQRKDLLDLNKKIFIQQAKALRVAKANVKCLVVANPANTNATILYRYSSLQKQNINCLTRLDHNRAISQIAEKAGVSGQQVSGVMIFGNHSTTQYPCLAHIKVNGKPIDNLVNREWLENIFIPKVQKRGGQILNVKGSSSIFSAAIATVDHLHDWYFGTNEIVSMGVRSNGQYGIPAGLWTSMPVRCKDFQYQIVSDISLTEYCRVKISATVKQLQEELQQAEIQAEIKPKL